MRSTGQVSVYMVASGVVFALVNLALVLYGLTEPSFRSVRAIYAFNTITAPCIFLCTGLLGLIVSRSRKASPWLTRASAAYFCLGIALVCVRIYATHIEPRRLVLREISFKSSKLREPLRILHISDIQSDRIGRYETRAFRRMKELRPDIVIHTGDLLQPLPPATFDSELPKITALLRELNPPLGIYSVYGDVDGRLRMMPKDGQEEMRLLENGEATIAWGGTRIRLYGLGSGSSRRPKLVTKLVSQWLASAGPGDLTILAGHSPDFAVSAQHFPVDLCLAGHTHGGQIRIPFYGPPVTKTNHIPRAWALGYREIGTTRLNVSAGIGSEHASGIPSIRVNCPPDMSLIVIEPEGGR